MAKMNWQKVSRDSQLKRQPTIDFNKTTNESKLQKLWAHAIKTETKFLSGKYWNQDIAGIVNIDPAYCTWILENQPTGVIAKQIIRHFNR